MPSSLSNTITATPSPNYLTSLTSSSTSTHSLPSSALDAIRCEFEREIEILNRFSGDVHPHLVSLQAAFRHGDDYCVIFPWAESDLRTLWRTRDSGDPLEKDNLKWVLEQCRGMASGLQAIHVYQTTETRSGRDGDEGEGARMRSIYGRHGDIKPENILLFRDQGDVSDRGRLVITDFGLARFHSDGTKTYFSHKELAVTMSYRPPESDMEGRTISRSVDIWSFGCLLLEFVSWHLGGWELIKKFMEARKAVNMLLYEWSFDQFFEVVRLKNMTEGPVYFRVKHEVHEVSLRTLRLGGFTDDAVRQRNARPPVMLRPDSPPARLHHGADAGCRVQGRLHPSRMWRSAHAAGQPVQEVGRPLLQTDRHSQASKAGG